jgi:hypothetical protein
LDEGLVNKLYEIPKVFQLLNTAIQQEKHQNIFNLTKEYQDIIISIIN